MIAIMKAISIHKLTYGTLVVDFTCKGLEAVPQELRNYKITTKTLSMKRAKVNWLFLQYAGTWGRSPQKPENSDIRNNENNQFLEQSSKN